MKAFKTFLLVACILACLMGVAGQDTLTITPDSTSYEVDLSSLDPADRDHPYVTQPIEITIGGSLSNPAATISISVQPDEGLILHAYEVVPFEGALPARTTVKVMVLRASDTGERTASLRVASGSASASTEVTLQLTREKIGVSVTDPEENERFEPGDFSIRGKVEPPLQGLIVNVDLFHRYPELKTQEQIEGYKSGIRYNGLAVTRADGTFEIETDTVAFERGFGTQSPADIEEGVWYIHYYTKGLVIFGEDLEDVNHKDYQSTVHGGVKAFDTEYNGIPEPLGSDVPEKHVRKFVASSSPDWSESIPLLPGLTRTLQGLLPSDALPYAPFMALVLFLLLILVAVLVVYRIVRR
jgi:hypothetical protein